MKIKYQDSTELKTEGSELFREMISFSVDDKRADMLAKIYSNGEVIAYNMDNNCYYSEDSAVHSPVGNVIPLETLEDLCRAAEKQVKNDYERIKINTMQDNTNYSNGFEFNVYEDMTSIVDSMQISSGTVIADLVGEDVNGNAIDAYIIVHGEVNVTFEDEDYDDPADFPEELKKLISQKSDWVNDERVYVGNNNWFELVVNEGYDAQVIDCEGCSIRTLYEWLAESINEEIDNGSIQAQKLPDFHHDFVMGGSGSYVNYRYRLPEDIIDTIDNLVDGEALHFDNYYNGVVLEMTKCADYDTYKNVTVDFRLGGKIIAEADNIHVTDLEEILTSIRDGEVQGNKTLINETRTLPQIVAENEANDIEGLLICVDGKCAYITATDGNIITCKEVNSGESKFFRCEELINNQDDKSVREALRRYKEGNKEDELKEIKLTEHENNKTER